MARRGRKRLSKPRHPGGEVIRERSDAVKGVVLAQPHRRGDTDQRRASALGRACRRARLRRECYDAGEDYAALVRRDWRGDAAGDADDQRLRRLFPLAGAAARSRARRGRVVRRIIERRAMRVGLHRRLVTVIVERLRPWRKRRDLPLTRGAATARGMQRA